MKAIFSADLNWGIGYKGSLLQRIPEDMKFFRQTTLGKVVIMGRKTFESLPGREPLKDRTNIILSAKGDFNDNRLLICRSVDELFNEIQKYPPKDVFVIGGGSIYAMLLPYCTEAYVTKIDKAFEADAFAPDLDRDAAWEKTAESDVRSYGDICYRYVTYGNNKPLVSS